jgi:hypothetical protein
MEEKMKNINKKIAFKAVITLIFFLFVFILPAVEAISSEKIEEDPNRVFTSDSTLNGEMNSFSKRYISVNDVRYSLCRKVKVFSTQNKLMPLKELEAAEEVKIFRNRGCVRKIRVLKFAQ